MRNAKEAKVSHRTWAIGGQQTSPKSYMSVT